MRRTFTCFLAAACWFLWLPHTSGQSNGSTPGTQEAKQDKPAKARRVWTNEELEKIKSKGGVNVVGEPTAGEKQPTDAAERSHPQAGQPEACDSDAWAAAVAAIAGQQGLHQGASFWATRLFGDACVSGVRLETVALRVNGDYVQDDGSKLRLDTELTSGGLPAAAAVVAALDQGRPFLVVWKKRPLLATNVNYIDRVYSDGGRVYTISKLTLVDPLSGRAVLFDAVRNPVSEIDGSLQVKASRSKR